MILPPKPGTIAGIRERLVQCLALIDQYPNPSPDDERRVAGLVFQVLAALLGRCWEVGR